VELAELPGAVITAERTAAARDGSEAAPQVITAT
jgi:hypothetical protein